MTDAEARKLVEDFVDKIAPDLDALRTKLRGEGYWMVLKTDKKGTFEFSLKQTITRTRPV